MRRVSLRPGRVVHLVAVVVWLSSFALPTIYFGGRGVAPGIGAFLLSFYVGPVAFVIGSAGGLAPQDLAAAAFYTVYFLWLGLQNLLVPVALAIRPARRRSVAAAAGLAAASVALVPFAELFRILELAEGERVRLEVGHLVWTLSFWLVAVAAQVERRVTVAGTPDDPPL